MPKKIIREFIGLTLLNNKKISDDENLLLSGLIDSLGVVNLIRFLESEFEIPIPPEDVTISNMASVDTISAYVDALIAKGD